MKHASDELISKLYIAEERISELEAMSSQTFQTEIQIEKKKNIEHNIQEQEDGGVEGRALTPSCENTRITTSCWTIINRKTLELTKNHTAHPKTKEKPQ